MLLINPYRFSPPRFISNDANVVSYILAVEAADGQQLESGVITAVESFITGCKSDGIWSAIKASCILAGARTLSGALVPLVGSVPTNNNFVTGDYNRKTGLLSNGSTKFLNTNRNNNADPQNSKHISCWVTERIATNATNGSMLIGTHNNQFGRTFFGVNVGTPPTAIIHAVNLNGNSSVTPAAANTGLHGLSRSSSANYSVISAGVTGTASAASVTPYSQNIGVFGSVAAHRVTARISFYSVGEALSLSTFNSRVSTLMTDFAAALP
jgi:hypothetical protein